MYAVSAMDSSVRNSGSQPSSLLIRSEEATKPLLAGGFNSKTLGLDCGATGKSELIGPQSVSILYR